MGPMHYSATTWTRALAIAQSQPLLKTKDSQDFLQKRTINQGCCPTGSQSPGVPMIRLSVTKISNKEPEQVPIKTYDSHANFWLMNNKIPYSFSAHEMKLENVW